MKSYQADTGSNDINKPTTYPSPDRGVNKTIPTQTPGTNPTTNVSKDPLIASGWEKVVYSVTILLFLGIVIVIGAINRKLEYAVLFAFLISLVGIALFFII